MNDTSLVPAEDSRLSFGQTALRAQDFVPPRVKVVQQMSKEAQGKKGEKVAEPGEFYNTLTGENYGDSLRIQPILPFMQRVFLVRENRRADANAALAAAGFEPLSEGDGLKCRSFDMYHGQGEPGVECNDCPLSPWRAGNKPPLCTETYNVAAANENGELVIISFAKSSAKIGKRFFSALRMAGPNVAPWTRFFDLRTDQVSNDQGTFFVPDFTIAKDRPDTGLIRQAVAWAEQLKGTVIDVSPADEDDASGGPGAPDVDDPENPF